MNIDRSTLLNLISNLAILIGLLFLGFEMRHNSLTTAAIVHQETVTYARDLEVLLLSDENEKLAEIVYRGIENPDLLSEQELGKFLMFITFRMAVWELAFVRHSEGLMSDRIWRAWDAWNIELVKQGPGYRTWWDSSRVGFDEEFGLHVDEVFSRVDL
jgi:hypothetical protein